jgi:hypothetical protein
MERCVIRDRDGNVIQRSRNLRGIREYVGKNIIKTVAVDRVGQGEGQLSILFENGSSFQTNFASFSVLCWFVRGWRNAYGAPLLVNGEECGTVRYNNVALMENRL